LLDFLSDHTSVALVRIVTFVSTIERHTANLLDLVESVGDDFDVRLDANV